MDNEDNSFNQGKFLGQKGIEQEGQQCGRNDE